MEAIAKNRIEEDIYKIILQLSVSKKIKFDYELKFIEDLGFSSLKIMEMVSVVAELYGFEPILEEIMVLNTIGDLIQYLEQALPLVESEIFLEGRKAV